MDKFINIPSGFKVLKNMPSIEVFLEVAAVEDHS